VTTLLAEQSSLRSSSGGDPAELVIPATHASSVGESTDSVVVSADAGVVSINPVVVSSN
jgi:hypothetical protein